MQDPIAIIGYSYRFPQEANCDEEFWKIIENGRSTMTEVPPERYNVDGYYFPQNSSGARRQDALYSRGGHFITGDVSAFDAAFFKMNAAETESMDPQLRLLLETTYHAFESAGVSMDNMTGTNTSVFLGNCSAEYLALNTHDSECHPQYLASGSSSSMLANRLSWFYDLRGPSVTLDTACSSTLVSLHLAVQSLLNNEAETALVGGANLQFDPNAAASSLSRLGFMSPDSHSYSFDDRANGYSRGEGVGMVVLKRLSQAIRDGDMIRAVIRGTSINQDGRTPSLTQPSTEAQVASILKAYEQIDLDLGQTRYFEAHGTGTAVGDPIEALGIGQAFSTHLSAKDPMYVGSVKANIGHLEPCSGIAGVIKTIMVLEKGVIPPNALLKNLNPAIPAKELHLNFPTAAMDWPSTGLRRASVNSFGFGGTNAHVILDDAYHYLHEHGLSASHNTSLVPRGLAVQNGFQHGTEGAPPTQLFIISSADEDGVSRQVTALHDHIAKLDVSQEDQHGFLLDLAFTLNNKRTRLPWKSFFLASTLEELQTALKTPTKPIRASKLPDVNFLFTGQGAQWAAMGKELLVYPVFKDTMKRCDAYIKSLGSAWSSLDELYAAERDSSSTSRIDVPEFSQTLCTVLQMALVDLLASWSICPRLVVGHSSGEIAAAYSVGVLSFESALRVAYFRGQSVMRLLQQQQQKQSAKGSGGGMVAVGLSETDLEPILTTINANFDKNAEQQPGTDVDIALACGCLNGASNTTVTGSDARLDALIEELQATKVFARKLNVPVAYHSTQMQSVADYYLSMIQGLERGKPASSENANSGLMFSSVTGKLAVPADVCQPEYWVANLTSQVKFAPALEALCLSSVAGKVDESNAGATYKPNLHLVEIGPHCALERPAKESVPVDQVTYTYDCTLRRGMSGVETLQSMVGRLIAHGGKANLNALNATSAAVDSHAHPRMLVNLPKYQFNHSKSYWSESRASRGLRTRAKPRHELLGTAVPDWNPFKPKWRLTIKESDLPWLSDHKIDGTVLYPASGMLVMAIEGARAVSDGVANVTGYRLRDVAILNAMVIPEDGIEVQLHMNAKNTSSNKQSSLFSFEIFSVGPGDLWKLHCSGEICIESQAAADVVSAEPKPITSNGQVTREAIPTYGKIDRDDFYRLVYSRGAHFGEEFRTIHDISYDRQAHKAKMTVHKGKWQDQVAKRELTEHLIHPTTLDGIIQAIYAAAYAEIPSYPTTIPKQMAELHISTDLLESEGSDYSYAIDGQVTEFGVFHLDGNITASKRTAAASAATPSLTIRGLRILSIQGQSKNTAAGAKTGNMFHKMAWKPDVSLLSSTDIEAHCHNCAGDIAHGGWDLKTEILSRYNLELLVERQSKNPVISPKPHIAKYLEWAARFVQSEADVTKALKTQWPGFEDDQRRPQLLQEYAAEGYRQKTSVEFFEQLDGIVRGDIDALDILFNHGLANAIYTAPEVEYIVNKASGFIDLLGHKASSTKMIEIGAGTGMLTNSMLQALQKHGDVKGNSSRFRQYDFTDISPSFFAEAKDKFTSFSHAMNFKVLDIERDPVKQGFEPHSYDVVLAAAVLHATSSIANTLKNIKTLLKPGGYVLLVEPTNKRMAMTPVFFGVLPGWWLATEKSRSLGPLFSRAEWGAALMDAGFDTPMVSFADDTEESHNTSLMITRAKIEPSAVSEAPSTTVIITQTEQQEQIAKQLRESITSSHDSACTVVSMHEVQKDGPRYDRAISLLELGSTMMTDLNEETFESLKRIVDLSNYMLWINDECGIDCKNPNAGVISGFSKSVMRERPSLNFTHYNVSGTADIVQSINRVLPQFYKPDVMYPREMDILEENGVIMIPRIVEAPTVAQVLESSIDSPELRYVDVDTSKITEYESLELGFKSGRLTDMHFKETDASLPSQLADDEVLVHVKATGINFKDVMVVLGQVPDKHIGQEFAGQVVGVGKDVSGSLNVGDRVCGVAAGSFRSHIGCKAQHVMKIPDAVSYAEASAVCVVYLTAQYALSHVARLQRGETVLIHAAAGGVGQAAIQLAQRAGAVIYVTVSTQAKRDLLIERYGLDPDHIFSSRHTLFAQQIMAKTNGRGLDVVLNSLSGHALAETWRCMASFGRFVEIGKRDIVTFQSLAMEPFERNVTFSSVDLGVVATQNDALMKQLTEEVEQLLNDTSFFKTMVPSPLNVFKLSQFEDAFRYLQTGQHAGKAVVDWEQQDVIRVLPKSQLDYTLRDDATYVIAGGLGGIGRSMATWLASQGAKHIALLSRSGPKTDAAKQTVAELEASGIRVYTPKCDITDKEAVRAAVQYMQANMPPIKGCIQSSMVIKNQIFENYTVDNFNDILAPKIQGTYNLHELMPAGMDFLVLMSSITGIAGSTSQACYGAGNTFLDAFARFRHAQGEHCMVLDLGIVERIGYIAERIDVAVNIAMAYGDYRPVREDDIHFLLKYVCSPSLQVATPWDTLITAALELPAFMRDEEAAKQTGWMRLPSMQHLFRMKQSLDSHSVTEDVNTAGPQLAAAKSLVEAGEIVSDLLARRLARSLAVPVEDIDVHKPPFAFGVDSLVAVELIYWFTNEIHADIPVVQILSNSTIAQLGFIAAKKSQFVAFNE